MNGSAGDSSPDKNASQKNLQPQASEAVLGDHDSSTLSYIDNK